MGYYGQADIGDMNLVNAIEYTRKVEHDWNEDGDTVVLYDIEAYDYNENEILWQDTYVEEENLAELVGPEVAQMIIDSKPDHDRLTDIMPTAVSNLDDVNEVNAMAKRIFPVRGYEGNERGYILTDGTFIYLGGGEDHMAIARIDGMKIAQFVSLGNIRVHYNSFELCKEPTAVQRQMLRYHIANSPNGEVYVDVIENTNKMYGRVLTAARFITRNPRVVLNQLDRWFGQHIKMQDYQDDDMYESKKVELEGETLTEEALRGIVREAFTEVITENRMSKNMAIARKYIRSEFPSADPQETLDTIRREIPNSRIADSKFLAGVARLYLANELGGDAVKKEFNKTLKFVGSNSHVNEYDNNLNGMDADEIIQKFATSVQGDLEDRRKDVGSEQYSENKGYRIVPIDSYEQAQEYSKYTEWCVTESEYMYDSYTNHGTGRFYFCLRDGFENVQKAKGNNTPLDEYGLSMIAVCVNDDGSCNSITCRWNHENGGDDNVMTDKELSRLLGRNFYTTFKPWTEQELRDRGIITVALAQELLKKGEKTPEELFTFIGKEHDGWRKLIFHDRTSFINSQNEFINDGKSWFDLASDFKNRICWVQKNTQRTFMDADGRLMGNGRMWFSNCYPFYGPDFAVVSLKDKGSTFVNREGEFVLGDVWFTDIVPPLSNSGYYTVSQKGKHTYMKVNDLAFTKDSQGNNVWWDTCYDGFRGKVGIVRLNDKYVAISQATNTLMADDMAFDKINPPHNGFMVVLDRNRGYSFINLKTGKLIGDGNIWLEYAGDFSSDGGKVCACIQQKGHDECCFMDKNLNLYDGMTGQPMGNILKQN